MDKIKTDQGIKIIGVGEAQVVSVNNNGKTHTVKVYHPDVGVTDFIPFIQTPGMFRTPRPGDICYVFMKENFYEFPMAWGHRISTKLAQELLGNRKENITLIYSSGPNQDSVTHKMELDDGTRNGIRVTTSSGNQVELTDSNEITVRHRTGSFIEVSEGSITLSVKGSTIVMNAGGVKVTSATGGTVDLTSSVKIDGEGSTVDIKSNLDVKSSDGIGKFDDITVSQHRHAGNLGIPTSPPFRG